MTWHIVCLEGVNDKYKPQLKSGDQIIFVPLNDPGHPDSFQSSVPQILTKYKFEPMRSALDLFYAAVAAYTGDVRIPRHTGYDGWSRDIILHLALNDLTGWEKGTEKFKAMLGFLTGDHWQVFVRQASYNKELNPGKSQRQQKQSIPIETKVVSLFSGGLDSFIGSLDILNKNDQVILVGHHASGQGATSVAQKEAEKALLKTYFARQIPFLKFWLTPSKKGRFSETTTRGRSILFLALGVMVASSLNGGGQFIIPENGFISLNVPLTPARSGSFSTRTTHPYLIKLLQELLTELKIPVTIELPYRFKTKGEMLIACADQKTLAEAIPFTMSCAHPGVGRFIKGGNPNQHCGYCIPCLVRRAAISSWGEDKTSYKWDDPSKIPAVNNKATDLRSLRIALDRYANHPPRAGDLLTSGPIPGDSDQRKAYLDMFARGLNELRSLVSQFGG